MNIFILTNLDIWSVVVATKFLSTCEVSCCVSNFYQAPCVASRWLLQKIRMCASDMKSATVWRNVREVLSICLTKFKIK